MWIEMTAAHGLRNGPDYLLFSENRLRIRLARGLAERYLRMSAKQLLLFYRHEQPIELRLGAKCYVLPMSEATCGGTAAHENIRCLVDEEPHSADPSLSSFMVEPLGAVTSDRRTHDGRVVRLASFGAGKMVFQEASYYSGFATNFAMDHKPKGRAQTLREYLHGETRTFRAFDESFLVNHLGVVCMLESADGLLVAQRRSRKVANRGRTLSASASGAVNWTDLRRLPPSLSLEVLGQSIFRETLEELGVRAERFEFLGLMREFLRGGKPELYYYARVDEPFSDLTNRWREAEGRSELRAIEGFELDSDGLGSTEESRDRFRARLHRTLERMGKQANLTLIAGTALAGRFLLDRAGQG